MKDQIKMILFVVILGVVAAAILMGTDSYTATRIEDNQSYALKTTILSAFGVDFTEANVTEVYENGISSEVIDGHTFYYSEDGSVGFEVEGGGLWGPIEGFLTLEEDLATVKGIQIIYHEETPGLGGVLAEQWYLDKYTGKQFAPEILILKNADMSKATEVDAITGATMTSDAFQLLLNENYQLKKEVLAK